MHIIPTLAFAFSLTSFANSKNLAASSLLYGPGTDPYFALYAWSVYDIKHMNVITKIILYQIIWQVKTKHMTCPFNTTWLIN